MNSSKSPISLAILMVTSFIACNYTDGECYLRGQGEGSDGVGGSIIVTNGAGGFGDTPPGPPDGTGALVCNAPEETPPAENKPEEAGLKVFCSKPDYGAPCSDRCFAKGIGCVYAAVHPYKPEAGVGKLFSCNDLMVGFMCGYHYANGDDCYYPFGTPFPTVCSYSGND